MLRTCHNIWQELQRPNTGGNAAPFLQWSASYTFALLLSASALVKGVLNGQYNYYKVRHPSCRAACVLMLLPFASFGCIYQVSITRQAPRLRVCRLLHCSTAAARCVAEPPLCFQGRSSITCVLLVPQYAADSGTANIQTLTSSHVVDDVVASSVRLLEACV